MTALSTIRNFLLLTLLLTCASGVFAQESADTTVVFLVRHAEKQTGQDPSLTDEGRDRALALRDMLLSYDVEVLVASQFKRTAETLLPLSEMLGIEVHVRPLDTADIATSARAVVRALVEEFQGQTIVIAGHSNTIPVMASALVGIEITEFDERDYDKLLIVRAAPGGEVQLVVRNYGLPDPVE